MSTEAPLDAVSPHELARNAGRFTGEVAVTAFPRLSGLVGGAGGVSVALRFRLDARGRTVVEGPVQVAATLQCQRCLQAVPRTIDVAVRLCIVASDAQAAELIDEMDAVVVTDDEVSIVDLIEDDLLLALPSQVCRAFDECPDRPGLSYPADPPEELAARSNPFGVLAKLKAGD